MRQGLRITGVSAAALAVAVSGCSLESTQDKSARLAREAKRSVAEAKGLSVKTESKTIKVLSRTVKQDRNGVAIVVRVRNDGPAQVAVPIAFTVLGEKKKELYANDIPGLDESLVKIPLLEKGETFAWVNNQVPVTGRAKSVKVAVGNGKPAPAAKPPRMQISDIVPGSDQDGAYVEGKIANKSKVDQRRLTVFCVARAASGSVTSAGRAVIDKLPAAGTARKPTRFTAFLTGRPHGAVHCVAPPAQIPRGSA